MEGTDSGQEVTGSQKERIGQHNVPGRGKESHEVCEQRRLKFQKRAGESK